MKQISIRGLYHHFNYDIPLSEDGITILTGPNGFGKSTIIHCIEAISNSDLEFFFGLEFSRLEIQMDEDNPFVIEKKHDILLVDGERFDRRAVFYGKRALQRSYNTEDDARALKVYFEDFERKNEQYEDLIERFDLFTDIINRRFLCMWHGRECLLRI